MQNLYMINSPMEQFEVQTLIGLTSSMFNISFINITTFTLYIGIVLGLFYIISIYVLKDGKIISTRWNLVTEAIYSTIYNMVEGQLGKKGTMFFPFIFSLFMFILIANLVSMIPYNFAINAQLIFTLSLSVTIWVAVTILGFYNHKLNYFSLFIPSGTLLYLVPVLVLIEFISNLARSVSLGLRLGANILSGHLLLTILCGLVFDFMSSSFILFIIGFIPLSIILGIVGLEFAIAGIQAYVFCILTCTYINDAINLH